MTELDAQTLRIFIGSGEASLIERKVLAHSLRERSSAKLDIRIFNGTHDAVERDGQAPVRVDMPLNVKYRNRATEFSLYRFLIPKLCGYEGHALWLDSDIVCLRDPAALLEFSFDDADMFVRADAYPGLGTNLYAPSVAWINCASPAVRFDLDRIYAEIDDGAFTYDDFSRLSPAFLSHHPMRIGALPRQFNDFDFAREDTVFLHYTELTTQPWKFAGHPDGDIWFHAFEAARRSGAVSDSDIHLQQMRAYVRPDLLRGNSGLQSLWYHFKRLLRLRLGRHKFHHG